MLVLHVSGRFFGLLMVLYGFGWFWPVIYCNGSLWHDLWIDLDAGRWLWQILDDSCHFRIDVATFA